MDMLPGLEPSIRGGSVLKAGLTFISPGGVHVVWPRRAQIGLWNCAVQPPCCNTTGIALRHTRRLCLGGETHRRRPCSYTPSQKDVLLFCEVPGEQFWEVLCDCAGQVVHLEFDGRAGRQTRRVGRIDQYKSAARPLRSTRVVSLDKRDWFLEDLTRYVAQGQARDRMTRRVASRCSVGAAVEKCKVVCDDTQSKPRLQRPR